MKPLLLFDLDGTLWDSSDGVVRSWNEILQQERLPQRLTVSQIRHYMGWPMNEIADDFLHDCPAAQRAAVMEKCCLYENEYLRLHGGDLMPGLTEVLPRLAQSYQLAIVSNCQEGYIEAFLAYHQLESFFVDTENFGRTGLSKGENIRLLLARQPHTSAVYIGDTQKDCDAADAAGIPFIHAAYGFGTINRPTPAISALSELPDVADALTSGDLPFAAADILLPREGWERWSVIACDQHTSEPDYWRETERLVGDAPSTLRLILPEVWLQDDPETRITHINSEMRRYLESEWLVECPNAMIYVERTLPNGQLRRGLVGAIDLEAYSFQEGASSLIRATEQTVLSRIPPRVKIRQDACLELPHVMLLVDDPGQTVITPLSHEELPLLYDFDLMQGGGHLRGYLVPADKQEQLKAALRALPAGQESPLLFAVGDGNHSLATAKACYEQDAHPLNRYALAEIVNLHDDALCFEPIYRVVFGADVPKLLTAMQAAFEQLQGDNLPPQTIGWVSAEGSGTLTVPHPQHPLPVGTLQTFLDDYLSRHPEMSIDYIHGEDSTRALAAKPGCVGFLFEGMSKEQLFPAIRQSGALPRKTFSMGEAADKRYYTEARRIR